MAMVEMKGVVKKFGKFSALKGLSLQVEKGEIHGFIGPNGSGKTTTIRILLGLLKRTEGHAAVLGKDVWTQRLEIHKNITYVPGDVHLWPNMTGGEALDVLLKLHGSYDKKKKEELIQDFAVDVKKKCKTYSKGNRQKIALVAALAADAQLYILDEPTSGLDPLMERVFQQKIFDLKKEGKTVFLSSHILSEVERLCNTVSIIREGRIIESGNLEDLKHILGHRVFVETKEELKELERLEGVYHIAKSEEGYRFQVNSNNMNGVVKYLAGFNLVNFESMPQTLEDLFMSHYKTEGKDYEQ